MKLCILKITKLLLLIISGKYLDCGTLNGYIKSTLEIAKL